MTFEKYVNGPQFEDFTSVQTTDHIYVFEQKCKSSLLCCLKLFPFCLPLSFTDEDQPLYHNGHRVISSGTRLRIFDCNKKEWSQIKEIEAFKDQEDGAKLDEIVFNIYDEIYVLLFNRFEGVKLDSLWRFDHEHFKFEKYSSINVSLHNFLFYIVLALNSGAFWGFHLWSRSDSGCWIPSHSRALLHCQNPYWSSWIHHLPVKAYSRPSFHRHNHSRKGPWRCLRIPRLHYCECSLSSKRDLHDFGCYGMWI